MAKRIVPLILILALLGYFGHRFWTQRKAQEADDSFYGTVAAVEVTVSAQVTGRILELPVEEGRAVGAGDLLARIEDALYQDQVEQARAAITAARSQFAVVKAEMEGVHTALKRTRKLLSTGSATEAQMDDVETRKSVLQAREKVVRSQVAQAETALALAETQLGYTTIRAPLSGTLVRRDVEAGETVFPGTALGVVADLSVMDVKIYVPGPMLGRIRIDQKVKLLTDSYADRWFHGTVAMIAEKAEFTPKNVQTREERIRLVYRVKVRVPNPDGTLKTGMPVDAWFVKE